MKPSDFDLKIIKAIKAFRLLRGIKQVNLAKHLEMTESNYCKIEKGRKALTVGQVKIIANYLGVPLFQITCFAEGDEIINFKLSPLSKILIEYALILQKRGEEVGFTEEELKFVILKD
jgi:transcriptional regulator with XRE-family HTH domain